MTRRIFKGSFASPARFTWRLLLVLLFAIARYCFARVWEDLWDAASWWRDRKRVGRSMLRKIYWGSWLCIFILFVFAMMVSTGTGAGQRPSESSEHAFLTALGLLFWVWFLFGRAIAYRLVPLFVSKLSCPGCDDERGAVDTWNCSCGFHDHQERHILASRCPMCGKTAGHVTCRQCNCTILLW